MKISHQINLNLKTTHNCAPNNKPVKFEVNKYYKLFSSDCKSMLGESYVCLTTPDWHSLPPSFQGVSEGV